MSGSFDVGTLLAVAELCERRAEELERRRRLAEACGARLRAAEWFSKRDEDLAIATRLRDMAEQATGEMPFVCPGCHAVAEEPCVPGCVDAEIEAEQRHAIESGNCHAVSE